MMRSIFHSPQSGTISDFTTRHDKFTESATTLAMPWLPPDVDPNILSCVSLEQWNAGGHDAETGPAPHTLEQQAAKTASSTTVKQSAATMTSPAQPASFPQHHTIYDCTITKDLFMPTLDLDFKKGMQGQLLAERNMPFRRTVVTVFVMVVTEQNGGYVANA
jgi:hypothetical protein